MRNLIKSILILFISFYSVNAFAATGAATEYKVTMTKLELCETGSTTANCLNPLTISPSIQFEAAKNFIDTTGVEDEENFKIVYYNPPRNKSSLQDGFLSSTAFEKGDVEAKMKDKVGRRNAMTIEVQGAVILTKQ